MEGKMEGKYVMENNNLSVNASQIQTPSKKPNPTQQRAKLKCLILFPQCRKAINRLLSSKMTQHLGVRQGASREGQQSGPDE